MTLSQTPSGLERGLNPLPDLSPLNAFVVSLRRLWRLKSNVPLPKQFSGSAPESA